MSEPLTNAQLESLSAVKTQVFATEDELSKFVESVRRPLSDRIDTLHKRWLISTIVNGVLLAGLIACVVYFFLR